MSQAPVSVRSSVPVSSKTLTAPEPGEIIEYQKIVQFRDTVVSGKHPRIKVPTSVLAKHAAASNPSSSSAAHGAKQTTSSVPQRAPSTTTQPVASNAVNGHALSNMHSVQANKQQPGVTIPPASTASVIPGFSKPFGIEKPSIDPVLLEKSDDLVKAESQIRRQRAESALKDQADQQSAYKRSHRHLTELLSELDLTDILAKALTIVQLTAPPQPPPTTSHPESAANVSDASDSFDENTFYSSQHDTPDSRASNRPHNVSEDVQMQDAHTPKRTAERQPGPPQTSVHQFFNTSARTNQANATSAGQGAFPTSHDGQSDYSPRNPALSNPNTSFASNSNQARKVEGPRQRRELLEAQVISSESRGASRSDHSGNTESEHSADQQRLQASQNLMPNPNIRQLREPLIRAHNLSPLAPQPAHVSPLAVARQPQLSEMEHNALQRVPSQVTTVRQDHALVISPDSSPQQGERGSKKKTKKKNNNNKRKSDAKSRENHPSPEIKAEPRSPSPVTAAPFLHPPKRRRGDRRGEVIYDDSVPNRPISQMQVERLGSAVLRVESSMASQGHGQADDPYLPQIRHSIAPVNVLETPWYEERRPDGTIVRYMRPAQAPLAYNDPHSGVESRPVRTASYSVMSSDYRDGPVHPREGRMSVRPYVDRARSRSPVVVERHSSVMQPPAPPRRVVLDEFGREYIEPPHRSSLSRQSMMPPSRPAEPEVIYDRAPTRAMSRIPASEIIGEDGTIYRRASPGYTARRVITQPEYGSDIRTYRERDYSTQPMGPPSQEYYQIRGGTEQRVADHMSREYLPRAASVRPADPLPYERFASAHPDFHPRQYATSVHPESRREPLPQVIREHSTRPAEQLEVPQRAFSVRPAERYYEQAAPEEGMTYIERPRAVHQEIVYPDGTRRQVYQ